MDYIVSNLHLCAHTPGLPFYSEKKFEDHCKTGESAQWTQHIMGTDEGDGWLRVETERGIYYLPSIVDGHEVLIPETWHEAPEPAHETEQDIHTTAPPEEHQIAHAPDSHTVVTVEPPFHETHPHEHAPHPSEEAHHEHPGELVQHPIEETHHETHHAPHVQEHPSEQVLHVQERELAPHPVEETHHVVHDKAHDHAHAEEPTHHIRAPVEVHKPVRPAPLATAAAEAASAAAKAYAVASGAHYPTAMPYSGVIPLTASTALPGTGVLPGTGSTQGGDAAAGNDPVAHVEADACLPGLGGRAPVAASNEIMFAYVQTLGRRVEEAINTVSRDMVSRVRALEERPEHHWQVQQLDNRLNKVEMLTKKLAEKAFKLLSNHNSKKDEEIFKGCLQKAHQQSEMEKVQGMEKDMAKLAAQVGSRLEALEATWERHFASDVCHRLDELEHNCKLAFTQFHSELSSMRDEQHHEVQELAAGSWVGLQLQEMNTIETFLGQSPGGTLAIADSAPAPLKDVLQTTLGSINTEMDQYRSHFESLQDNLKMTMTEVLDLKRKVDASDAVRMGDVVMELHHKIEELGADLQKFGMVQEAATEICEMQRAARQVRDSAREHYTSRDGGLESHRDTQKETQRDAQLSQNVKNVTTMLRDVEARVDRNETRLTRSMTEITEKLMPLQDFVEQQRLTTWTVSRQVPDLAKKVDQLWTQCQTHFTKIKEHDIHMNFMSKSMESHKQHALDLWPSARGKPAPASSDVEELEERLRHSNGAAPPGQAVTPADSASASVRMPPPKRDGLKERPSIFS